MLWAGVAFLGFLQIIAVVLNLLPIPGLDGYGALEPHLSPETQRAVAPAKQYGVFILLFLLLAPVVNQWFFGFVDWFFDLSGVPHSLASCGQLADPVLEPLVLTACIYASITHILLGYGRRTQSHPRRGRRVSDDPPHGHGRGDLGDVLRGRTDDRRC